MAATFIFSFSAIIIAYCAFRFRSTYFSERNPPDNIITDSEKWKDFMKNAGNSKYFNDLFLFGGIDRLRKKWKDKL